MMPADYLRGLVATEGELRDALSALAEAVENLPARPTAEDWQELRRLLAEARTVLGPP